MQKLVKIVRGVRSSGSAALDMAYVAEGALDAYLAMGLSPWDIAGGTVLVNEVGGRTTNHLGEPLHMLKRNSLLTSRNSIHSDLIQQFLKKGQKRLSYDVSLLFFIDIPYSISPVPKK